MSAAGANTARRGAPFSPPELLFDGFDAAHRRLRSGQPTQLLSITLWAWLEAGPSTLLRAGSTLLRWAYSVGLLADYEGSKLRRAGWRVRRTKQGRRS